MLNSVPTVAKSLLHNLARASWGISVPPAARGLAAGLAGVCHVPCLPLRLDLNGSISWVLGDVCISVEPLFPADASCEALRHLSLHPAAQGAEQFPCRFLDSVPEPDLSLAHSGSCRLPLSRRCPACALRGFPHSSGREWQGGCDAFYGITARTGSWNRAGLVPVPLP